MIDDWLNNPQKLLTPAAMATVAAGFVAGVVVMLIGRWLLTRRRAGGPPDHRFGKCDVPGRAVGSLPVRRPGEKRTAARREGPAVRVMLATPDEAQELARGHVVDRSVGGVCILVSRSFPVGTALCVRPVTDELLPWIPIEVRNCRREAATYLLGCAFRRPVSWSVAMHLG